MSAFICKSPERLTLSQYTDERGHLYFGEIDKDWDFAIKRIYFAKDFTKGTLRGGHAHKNLQQIIIVLSGKIEVKTDNGRGQKESWVLEEAGAALRLYPPVWREIISHSDDALFIVLASHPYEAEDYIRHYEDFKKLCGK
jgi:dTDP-4-dehydrorhamnose 3,5-epimerase-like enzyme